MGLALRFIPYSDDHGHFNLGWTLVLVAFALFAFGASLYLVYVLEIFKFSRFRREEGVSDEEIEHEIETGEWDAVRH